MSTAPFANAVRCRDVASIDFLSARPRSVTWTEAARVPPEASQPPAHDAFTRLRHRLEPDPATLGHEARPLVPRSGGVLVVEDATRDEPSAKTLDRGARPGSGTPKRVGWGINLITRAWTDGARVVPGASRVSDQAPDGRTQNDHSLAMLRPATARGFEPTGVPFARWDSGREDLKAVRACGWTFLTPRKAHRRVNPGRPGLRPVSAAGLASGGTGVWLEGSGEVRVFKVVSRDGDIESGATNDLRRDELGRWAGAERCWAIEDYPRGRKQGCGVERAQVRATRAQRNHIGLAIRAFLRLEYHFDTTGISWYEAKAWIVRGAVRAYIARPLYGLS